jgi:hypothetical protein
LKRIVVTDNEDEEETKVAESESDAVASWLAPQDPQSRPVVDLGNFTEEWEVVNEFWWPLGGERKWTQLWLELYHPGEDQWAAWKAGWQIPQSHTNNRNINRVAPHPAIAPAVERWRKANPELEPGCLIPTGLPIPNGLLK